MFDFNKNSNIFNFRTNSRTCFEHKPKMSNDTITFDITIDGSIQDVKGNIEGIVLDPLLIHRLLDNAQKSLVDEEVVSLTVSTNDYTLRISANGAKYSGIIKRNDTQKTSETI